MPAGVDDAPAVRRSPGRPPIASARIVDAALQVIDEQGLDSLSMRSLAKHLNSSTATLYRHFPTRAALVQGVIDRVMGEVDVDAANFRALTWRQGCEKISLDIFEAFGRHRQTALLLADHTPIGPNAAAVRERTLAVLIDGGFDVKVAARTGAMLAHLILGFASQYGGERETTAADRETFRKAIHGMDLSQFPATAAVRRARWLPTTVDQEFQFALQLLLDGLGLMRSGG
jgi:AcrR family transcriptional regulator